jgi:hypothetical protein
MRSTSDPSATTEDGGDMVPDDPANNFLGYSISTTGRLVATHARRYKKYATRSVYTRRVLLVVDSQVRQSIVV